VITVVSFLFPESSERGAKVFFGNVRSYSLLTTFFVLMNEVKEWINIQKQIYGKFFRKNVNFSEILRPFYSAKNFT